MTIVYAFPRDLYRCVELQRFDTDPISFTATARYAPVRRVTAPSVELWMAEMAFDPSDDMAGRRLKALMSRIRSGRNLVRMFDPTRRWPRGTAAGLNQANMNFRVESLWSDSTPFADGTGWLDGSLSCNVAVAAMAGERSIQINGLVANQALAFMGGDLFELNGCLYEIEGDVASDGAGAARVGIVPGLWFNALPGDVVNLDHPSTQFQLMSPDAGRVSVSTGGAGGLWSGSLSLIEVPPR